MAQINANITQSVFPGGPTFPAVAVDWGAAYDAEYTLIEFKLTTENDLVVNTFNIETSSHIYYMYLLKDLPKANTSYKLYLTGILEDGTKDDESTSPAYSFTSPTSFGTLDGVVFNDIDNTNYIFQIAFAEIVDPYWLDKLQEYKLTVSKDNFSKTIDITNGGYYSLYNICDGNISAGEYTFKIFFTMKNGSEVFTSSEVIKTQNYEKDTRVSLQITGLSISVNETDQQKCTVKYTSESTFDNTLKIYKNNVLKTSIENVTNGFTFYPHDGAYNLDGGTTYSAVLETRRVFPQYNNITETGTSNTATFFLNTLTAPVAPDGLYIDKNLKLSWSKIENADKYTVNILNSSYDTTNNYYDLSKILENYIGRIEITVVAINGAGSAISVPFYYINRPSTVTGIQCLNLDRENKQVTFSWTPQLQYLTEVKYSIYLNNLLLASNLSNASYTFDYTNFFKDGGRYVISVDAIVNGIGTQPMGSLTYTYKEINVEKDAIKKAKIKKTDGSETPEYPISVDAENVIVEYDDGTSENVKVILEDKAEREFYQDEKISIGHNSSIKQNSYTVAVGQQVVAGGANSIAIGDAAHADGLNSSSFGNGTYANAECSHAEGQGTAVYSEANYSHAEGYASLVGGVAAHAEGSQTNAMTNYSHAEGTETVTSGVAAHAEGVHTVADGEGSHAEGYWTAAYGAYSHAEGASILNAGETEITSPLKAEGIGSHAEGLATIAAGDYSHSEGKNTKANGRYSHAGGVGSIAGGDGSFVHGTNLQTSFTNEVAFGFNNNFNEVGTIRGQITSNRILSIGGGGNPSPAYRQNLLSLYYRSDSAGRNLGCLKGAATELQFPIVEVTGTGCHRKFVGQSLGTYINSMSLDFSSSSLEVSNSIMTFELRFDSVGQSMSSWINKNATIPTKILFKYNTSDSDINFVELTLTRMYNNIGPAGNKFSYGIGVYKGSVGYDFSIPSYSAMNFIVLEERPISYFI